MTSKRATTPATATRPRRGSFSVSVIVSETDRAGLAGWARGDQAALGQDLDVAVGRGDRQADRSCDFANGRGLGHLAVALALLEQLKDTDASAASTFLLAHHQPRILSTPEISNSIASATP